MHFRTVPAAVCSLKSTRRTARRWPGVTARDPFAGDRLPDEVEALLGSGRLQRTPCPSATGAASGTRW
jgi:hypothetical protein